ncbi:hypothetical protein BGX34_005305 [Mortierella sp. NVP85]|nr:hypothetical protein BGX34_005305 [Mortierella sp. NVP85]
MGIIFRLRRAGSKEFNEWYRSWDLGSTRITEIADSNLDEVVDIVGESFTSVTAAIRERTRQKLGEMKDGPGAESSTSAPQSTSGKRKRSDVEDNEADQRFEEVCDKLKQSQRELEHKDDQLSHLKKQVQELQSRLVKSEQQDLISASASASTFKVESKVFRKQVYVYNEVDVGTLFYKFQCRSTRLVNKVNEKVTLNNIGSFLSMNYVYDMQEPLEGLSSDVHFAIKEELGIPVKRPKKKLKQFCQNLDDEMRTTGTIQLRAEKERNSETLVTIYRVLSNKLPARYLPFSEENEDTFAHAALDVFMSNIFPSDSKFRLSWANRPTEGTKYRRGNPRKPDATILGDGLELVFLELKPPRMDHHASLYLEDYWKLVALCKDAINDHITHDRGIKSMAAIQVFGHEMALYVLHVRNGIYHWIRVMIATLPRDKDDSGKVERCVGLMMTLKGPSTQDRT